ncbi:MAG: tRNA (N6-isopentenyl adenosine(37)-C2)-methylthiotransferase MiaB [Myxococcales bacterium]|nr:tRNA (N6-isopentenyl adenosine(37)-C2)-methylthiotransferase MiaB [Myxococcales bacterium]
MTTVSSHTPFHAPGRGRSVFIETYGCQMNVADSQLMQGILEGSGYVKADSLEAADVILINTCAVRERAEERVISRVNSLKPIKDSNPSLVLAVCGCMAEHLKDTLFERAPMIDIVVGPDAYRRLPDLIDASAGGDSIVDVALDKNETYEGVADTKVDGINGWISIQRGCDKFCTFCIVPFVRGRERGTPPREVLRQARALVEQGAVELTLLGQTVNSYKYEDVDFADLLGAVETIEGIRRIRFTSPYPLDFSPKLIKHMAASPLVMPHVHLPLQSGSDRVLEVMKRGHTYETFKTLVGDLRSAMPTLGMTTDIIVGFPGETDDDFEQTLAAVEEIRFDSAFMFYYSERSNTYASRHLPDDVPMETKKARLARLIKAQEAISAEIFESMLGTTHEVMVNGPSRRSDDDLVGKTPCFKSVVFPRAEGVREGDVVSVQVERTTSHTLIGKIV